MIWRDGPHFVAVAAILMNYCVDLIHDRLHDFVVIATVYGRFHEVNLGDTAAAETFPASG
jgi:hypothetical protein